MNDSLATTSRWPLGTAVVLLLAVLGWIAWPSALDGVGEASENLTPEGSVALPRNPVSTPQEDSAAAPVSAARALDISPLAFAMSASNAYRCVPALDGDCSFVFDSSPWVARSPAEARWMTQAGYPNAAARSWAEGRAADEVIAEGIRRNSTALQTLGWLLKAQASDDADDTIDIAARLSRAADEQGKVFALGASAAAYAHAAVLDARRSEDGPGTVQRTSHAAVDTAMKASVLGDTMALRLLPLGFVAQSGISNDSVAAMAAASIQSLRANDIGVRTAGRPSFGVADIAPRPVPIRQTENGREWWVSED